MTKSETSPQYLRRKFIGYLDWLERKPFRNEMISVVCLGFAWLLLPPLFYSMFKIHTAYETQSVREASLASMPPEVRSMHKTLFVYGVCIMAQRYFETRGRRARNARFLTQFWNLTLGTKELAATRRDDEAGD